MNAADKEHGEGNYKASRQYNDATKKFVESGRVDEAARKAAPQSQRDVTQMAEAEAAGRSRAKEEDPALQRQAKDTERQAKDTEHRDDSRGTPSTERSAEQTQTPKPGSEGG